MEFPRRIYTVTEVLQARECVEAGHKHRLTVEGSKAFKAKVQQIKRLLRLTGYYDVLRTYIRSIKEVEGMGQLRETEATIWLNSYLVENPVEGARFVVQKTEQMKDYLAGREYYEKGERRAIKKSIAFLEALGQRRLSEDVKQQCAEALRQWTDGSVL